MRRLALLLVLVFVCTAESCDTSEPVSTSGVSAAKVEIQTGSDGLTQEQRNIRDRLALDNKPGSIKHLYVISAYSGQVLIYSTVRGKITSSGKRLAPYTVVSENSSGGTTYGGFKVQFPVGTQTTMEVLEDDGTYGSSVPYVYWWDTRGVYHQHYIEGGQIVHVSDQPIAVKNIVLNMELSRQ